MTNKKIHYPLYDGGNYGCLEELIVALYINKWQKLSTHICDIVEYNVTYRDCLRENGIDGLIAHMCAEAPSFTYEEDAIKELQKWYPKVEKIADYDIQCYGIEDTFDVLGQTFHGLQEIRSRVEIFAREGYNELHTFSQEENADSPDGMHIGELYQNFPKFDADADDRNYGNYIIRKSKITKADMESISKVPACGHDEASRLTYTAG